MRNKDLFNLADLVTKSEAAEILGINLLELDDLVDQGLVSLIKINEIGATRVKKESLIDLSNRGVNIKKLIKCPVKTKTQLTQLQRNREAFIDKLEKDKKLAMFDYKGFEFVEGYKEFIDDIFNCINLSQSPLVKVGHNRVKNTIEISIKTQKKNLYFFVCHDQGHEDFKFLMEKINEAISLYKVNLKACEIYYTCDQLINIGLLTSKQVKEAENLHLFEVVPSEMLYQKVEVVKKVT